MNLLIAAQTGAGKSYMAQWITERQLTEYSRVVVMDYKDEYGGLVDAYDPMKYWICGEEEQKQSKAWWYNLINQNEAVQLRRVADMLDEDWADICGTVSEVAMGYNGSVLVVIDEAHLIAPNKRKTDPRVLKLATTGRGTQTSSIWITQRLQKLDGTIISQCNSKLLGPMSHGRDRKKIASEVGYNAEVHNPSHSEGLQFHDVGSDWIWSVDGGDHRRLDSSSSDVQPHAPHKGKRGKEIVLPD